MKRNPLIIVVVAVVVALMLFIGIHTARRYGPGSAAASLDIKGHAAPEFALQSLDNKTVHLSDFRGKAVLLNFWATWCSPCKIEMPWFVELQQQYGPQGLQVIGIAMDDASKEDIAKFAKDLGVNFQSCWVKSPWARLMGVSSSCPRLSLSIATARSWSVSSA